MNAIPTQEQKTVGLSPKVVAASISTYLAGLAAAYVGNHTGLDYDPSTFEALVSPLAIAAVTFVAGLLAKPGLVVPKGQG